MPLLEPMLIAALVLAVLTVLVVVRAVRIVPQAGARNVERLGRYHRTLAPGLNFVIPFVDRVYPGIDLREQIVSFAPQPVITEDNLVVEIDTVLYFQVTDPRSAAHEIASYRPMGAARQPGGDQGHRPAAEHQGRDGEASSTSRRSSR